MKHLLTLTFLSIFGLTHAQVPSYVPTNGLVGWWPFNGNANDESGNGNNGTVNGATLTADRNGVANCAYSFDGVSNNIIVPNSNSLNVTELSIAVWYLANGNNMAVISKNNPLNCTEYSFGIHHQFTWNSFGPSLYTSTGNGNCGSTLRQEHWCPNNVVPSNQWVFIVFTINNIGQSNIYLDGSLLDSYTGPNLISCNTSSSTLRFGGPHWNTYNMFTGLIDDIGIWNRALTECEIQDLYHAQVGFTTVNAGQDQTVCRGAEVTLNGIGGNFLSWNNGVFNGVPFAPNQTSNYVLTGSDSLGCVGSDTVLVTVLDNASSTINQTAIDSYTLNGQTYTQSGTYTQVLTAANGCDSTITLNLVLDFTGIQTNTLPSLKLYPNPVQDVLQIEGLASKEFEFEVLSIDGKLLQKGKSQGEISVKELRKGNYVLRVGQQQVSFVRQ